MGFQPQILYSGAEALTQSALSQPQQGHLLNPEQIVIYGRKEEKAAGSRVGALANYSVFPVYTYAAISTLLNGMFALLPGAWLYKYGLILRGCLTAERQSDGGSNGHDHVPGPVPEPDQ